MAASAYFETVQKIYIAFYQRPADPAGLKYWAEQIDLAGGNPNAVITAFGTSDEAQELYGDIDADTIGGVIDAVYQAAFGRSAEQEEIDYWAEGFNAGTITASSMALAVVLGAQNDDLATIDNKLEVANEFTAQVDGRPLTDAGFGTGPFAATYEGTDDAVAARDVLVNVTADPDTILSAEDITTAIQDTIADEGDPIVTPEVPTFTLAAGAASVAEGSDVEFTLTASVASDTDRTFQVVITGDDKNGTVGITKADDADFVDAVQIVVLPAGETEVTFSLNPEANDGAEGFQGFKVTLLDEGFNAVAASGTVVITDVTTDTEAPVVTAQTAPATYAENSAAGTVVATVAATDDTAVTGYTLTGNDAGFFAIDAAGNITLTEAGAAAGAAANDYETGANSFTLGVVAVDEAGNQSAAVNYVLNVTNVDDDAPALIGSSAAGSTVRLNFSEALKAAVIANPSAVFTVSQGSTSFSINSAAISGNVVTLTLATALAAGDTFVSYNGTVLEDAAGNKTAAIASTKVTSTDIVAPTLSSSNPADDSTTFGAASNLVLTFSEAVVAGSGQIKIVNTVDATDTRTIDIKDAAQVTISGTTLTINPTADLKAGGTYAVNIDATAVLDAAGNAYAGIANNTTLNFTAAAVTPPVVPGQTFTLTTSIDNIPGLVGTAGTTNTDGDDLILADAASASTADQVNGGLGVNTFKLYDGVGAADLPTLSKVQVFDLVNFTTTTDFSAYSDLTTLKFDNATSAQTFTAGAAVNFELKGMADAETIMLVSTATDTTHNITVTDMGTIAGAGVTVNANGLGVTTINLTTSGTVAAGTDSHITLASTGNETTVNVAGSGDLALTTAASVVTVEAAGATANLTLVTGATTTATSIKTGAGNDNVTATAAVNYTIDLGAGNDVLTTADAAGELTTLDLIAGGLGTDTLAIVSAEATGLDDGDAADNAVLAKITGFEQLRITDALAADLNLGNLGYNYLQVTTALGADRTISGVTSGFTFESRLAGNAANDYIITMTGATGAGTNSDTINIKLNADQTANDQMDSISFDLAGINIVNINAVDRVTTSNPDTDNNGEEGYTVDLAGNVAANSANINTVNVTGTQKVAYTVNAATAGLTTFDAAAHTGEITFVGTAFAGTQGVTIKGGSKADALTGTGLADVIDGGAGNDAITGGIGADVMTGGAGVDTFTFANTATGLPSATVFDTITDFAKGVDIIDGPAALTISQSGTATVAIAAINAEGIASFNVADDTLAEKLIAVAAGVEVATATTAGDIAIFEHGSDSYVFITDATAGLSATDVLIKLTGVTGLTDSTITGGDLTIA